MKVGIFKGLSRLFIFVLLVYTCTFSSAGAQPGNSMLEKLDARISAYKDMFRSGDYTGAASFVSPNMINRIGGEENFARLVQKFTDSTIMTLDPSLVEFSKPEEIVPYNDMYISVIRQIIPITTKGIDEEMKDAYLMFNPTFPASVFEGMDGVFKMSVIAYSEDEGNTWFITGGNKMSLNVENIGPEILEKIDIPVPTLIFGEGSDKIILYRQNKQWIRSASGISEGLPEESIILTIGEGEQMEDSGVNITEKGVPDDSLDAYIYLEEHYIEPGKSSAKPAEQVEEIKEPDNRQTLFAGSLDPVFVTSKSKAYHKPDCSELVDGNLIEFDSPEEALASGGVPCKQCYPQ
ncbi:MAG TPA: hypothetical protein ENH82_20340 [bacterium]|nr:hypothetical protein [bacterium]